MEEKVKEEKVEEEMTVGAGQWLKLFLGPGRQGPSWTCHGTPRSSPASTPKTLTTPSSCPRTVRLGLSVF